VARLDGDLFGVLVTGLPSRAEAVKGIELLLDRCTASLAGTDSWFALSASAGAAIGPGDGRSASDLLVRADLALERAKASGGVARFHDESNYLNLVEAGPISRCLSSAMSRNELYLEYQPFLDGRERRVCAAEALLRWKSSELGMISPGTFVPLAEESGLMVPIGTWVMATACRQLRSWMDEGLPPIRMSVNVSLCQLVRSDFVSVVRDIIEEARIEPHLLELELSERGALRSDPDILERLQHLKALGVRLALDDFGTGNSTIVYLKDFPIDIVKIDRSFISGVMNSAGDAAIASATIAMARELGLDIIAEGVEQRGQVDFLRLHGCDQYQGFLFSPAISPIAFGKLLASGELRHSPGY
jgi:EAL domain-containing protein (putative c-di-GMP-specific phosphodiesterase class I)